jgi:hypothetical protein
MSVVCVSSDITSFEYKLIKKDSGSVAWEEPAFVNRHVRLETSGDVIITGNWGDNSSLLVTGENRGIKRTKTSNSSTKNRLDHDKIGGSELVEKCVCYGLTIR